MLRPTSRLLQPIRIPTLSGTPHPPAPYLSIPDSVDLIVNFLKKGKGKTAVLTGAGVSVDSGIRVSPLSDEWLSCEAVAPARARVGWR